MLVNVDEVRRSLEELYPAGLKAEGIGGTVALWIHVDEAGAVVETEMRGSSGYPELDRAARRLALTRSMSFHPARVDGRPAWAWTPQALVFSTAVPAPPGGVVVGRRADPLPPCPTPDEYGEMERRGVSSGT